MMKTKQILLMIMLVAQMVFGQSTKPAYQDVVAANASNGKYAGLYMVKEKKKNGNILTKYYWTFTDASGVLKPRNNYLNGWFSSEELATSNIPVGFSIGGSGGTINTEFETNVLQGIADGTNDVGNNTYGMSRFPNTNAQPTNTLSSDLVAGDIPEYLNGTLHQYGLATGFHNNKLRTLAELPASKRYSWTLTPTQYMANSAAQAYADGQMEFGIWSNREVDRNGTPFAAHTFMQDAEMIEHILNPNQNRNFMVGFHDAAVASGISNYSLIWYTLTCGQGGYMWPYSGYYYAGEYGEGDPRSLFPWVRPASIALYQTSNGMITNQLNNKGVYYNDKVQYTKANYPLGLQFWRRSSGNIVLDAHGDRSVYVETEPTATIRGKLNRWSLPQPGSTPPDSDGPLKKYQHELHLGVYGFTGIILSSIYRMQVINQVNGGGLDLSNFPSSLIKTSSVWRMHQEANSWTSDYRPLDRYTTEVLTWWGLVSSKKTVWWDGNTNTLGFSPNAGDPYTAVNEGNVQIEGYPDGSDGTLNVNNISQSLGITYKMQKLNREHGLFSDSDKLLFFTDPATYRQNAEILAFGRLKGNKLFIVLSECRLESGETPITVTISNAKNGTTWTKTVGHGQAVDDVFVLPSDTYNTADIRLQYTSVKGVNVKVTGNLTSHTW